MSNKVRTVPSGDDVTVQESTREVALQYAMAILNTANNTTYDSGRHTDYENMTYAEVVISEAKLLEAYLDADDDDPYEITLRETSTETPRMHFGA